MVLTGDEEVPRQEGHAKKGTHGHIQPPVRSLCLSRLSPALPEALECLLSLAGKRPGSRALAGWDARPCWGSETSSDEAFSCLPTQPPLPGWVRPGLGQRRAGKTWGYWPKPLLPWPKHAIHSQWGPGAWHGGRPALHFPGDACFFRPRF